MATTESKNARLGEELTIVDCDSHVVERIKEELLPNVENKAIKQLIQDADQPWREILSLTRPTPGFRQIMDSPTDMGEGIEHKPCRVPEDKLEYLDEFGIDYALLTPQTTTGIATVNHEQTAVELANAYNRWVSNTFLGVDDRINPTFVVAPQKPEVAAEVIDRRAQDDFVGVHLPMDGLTIPLGHDIYHPIYEAAQDNDLPMVMHSTDSGTDRVFPLQRRYSQTFVESHAFVFAAQTMWHVMSLLCRGIPERYPELDFVFQEASIEWLPWMMWRLDDHYLQSSEDMPVLQRMPSEYVKDNFYFTTQPLGHADNPEHQANMIEMAGGADTLMFASDHPHPDFDPPSELFDAINGRLDEEDVRGIMGETAIELFDM